MNASGSKVRQSKRFVRPRAAFLFVAVASYIVLSSSAEAQQPPMPRILNDDRPTNERLLRELDLLVDERDSEIIPNYAKSYFDRQPTEPIRMGGQRRDDDENAWTPYFVSWQAPMLAHNPLYFEEVNLERHGLSFGVAQPAVSAGQFLGRTLALPYLMARRPPRSHTYTLGYQRPGNRRHFTWHGPGFTAPASAAEAAALAGVILLIP